MTDLLWTEKCYMWKQIAEQEYLSQDKMNKKITYNGGNIIYVYCEELLCETIQSKRMRDVCLHYSQNS